MLQTFARPIQVVLSVALLVVFAATTSLAIGAVVAACDGRLVSWLDDSYIHMAMARSLADHGVYGLSQREFASASSSPLWVLALGITYTMLGVGQTTAFILNILAAIGLLLVAAEQLSRPADNAVSDAAVAGETRWRGVGGLWRVGWAMAGALALTLAVAPTTLALGAMEHVAHAALMLIGVDVVARRLSDADELPHDIVLYSALILLPLLRYESLWLGALAVLGGLAARQWLFAIAALSATVIGPYAFGALSVDEGWWMLPAPILVKSGLADLLADGSASAIAKFLLWYPLKRLVLYVPLLAALMAISAIVLVATVRRDRDSWRNAWWIALALSLAGAWLHATFGSFGWGGRYEGYLLALFCVNLPVALASLAPPLRAITRRTTMLALAIAALTGGLLVHRGVVMHSGSGLAAATVWQRDFWPAEFIEQTHADDAVMAMNIGAVMWRSSPKLTDVLALGDREIATLVLAHRLDIEAVRKIAARREVKIAVLFDDYFTQWVGAPPPFIKVATGRPLAAPDFAFSIYVFDAADAAPTAEALRRFAIARPNRVTLEFTDPR